MSEPRLEASPFCLSSPGQSHLRVGKVNQDAAGSWFFDAASPSPPAVAGSATAWPMAQEWTDSLMDAASASPVPFVALAVSDGHGSEKYDRSDRGSAIAVWLSLQLSALAATRLSDLTNNRKDWMAIEAPRRLVEQWRRFVLEDAGNSASQDKTERTIQRYGATIIGCAITQTAIAFWQLGDGDARLLQNDGRVSRPVPDSEHLLGTETRSLCEPNAVASCRVSVDFKPAIHTFEIVLSTDGLPNSFTNDEDYDAFLVDAMARQAQLGTTFRNSMLRWMGRGSSFSGDDVSMAISGPMTPRPNNDEKENT